MSQVLVLDPVRSHAGRSCPMRIAATPDHRRWTCADCGIEIMWSRIEMADSTIESLVDALDLIKRRDEDWDVAESDYALAAGLLNDRMEKIERLLITGIDKMTEKEGQ